MAQYVFHIIGYGVLLVVNGVCYYFLHSHFYFIVLVLMIAAPFFSVLSAYLLRRFVTVELEGLYGRDLYGKQGETSYFKIQVCNPTWFVSLDAKLSVKVSNRFFDTEGIQEFSIPIHAKTGYTMELPIVATYPGLLAVSVTRIKIKDMLGFFALKKHIEETAEISIMPERITGLSYDKTALEQGMLESEESTKRGNDFSDVQEIREYIPGDKLMSIHWKLSAKRDILMVKDRVSMSDHQLVIVPELCVSNRLSLRAVLSITYSVILEMLESQTTVRLLYWSMARYSYEDIRIDYKEELDRAFARMFYEKGYEAFDEAASHMALVHPEMHAYLHVHADGAGAHITIRENA